MAEKEIEKYVVSKPIYEAGDPRVKGRGFDIGDMTRARLTMQRGEKVPLVKRDNPDESKK